MEIFASGTFWFWVLVIVFTVLQVIYDFCENGKGAAWLAITTLVVLQMFSDLNPLQWIARQWLELACAAMAYIVFGVAVWGRLQWQIKCRKQLAEARKTIAEFWDEMDVAAEEVGDMTQIPSHLEPEYQRFLKRWNIEDVRQAPRIADHKAWFIRASTCWVFNLIRLCTHDLLHGSITVIYNFMVRTLQADSDRIYRSLKP